ncbi:MAG: UvrD-helicase domain-containing protein [Treponema sp.]|nr:UvrD-helicase domain-containing protein [Candidatus Treponema caballi]
MSRKEPKDLLDVLEKEQLAAVTDTFSENSVVAAGAGSGKTYTLARRFAWLVCEKGIPVDRILTLTFTKKAAAEMYQRIYATLNSFTKILSDEQKERAETAVRDFSKARIQTLDSYCSSIIRAAVHTYGIRPDYTTDVEQAKEAIKKLALPFVLTHQDNPALQMLVNTRSPSEVADSLFASVIINNSTLTKPIQFTHDFQKQTDKALTKWAELKEITEELLKQIPEDLKAYTSKSETQINKRDDLLKLLDENKPVFPDITLPPADEAIQNTAILDFLQKLAVIAGEDVKLTKTSDAIRNLRPVFEEFSSLANFVIRWNLLNSLNPLLEEFQEECAAAKRTQGLLTFADAADLAITVLTNDKTLRHAEKRAYDKIMIDEFQDNNELQRNLLFLLSERDELCSDGIPEKDDLVAGKLFFVGDEKQSIYRFRGADVSVFNKLKDDLPKNLSLSLNFRSHPALIAAFNTLFGGFAYPAQIKHPYNPGPSVQDAPTLFRKGNPEPYEATYTPAFVPTTKFPDDKSPVSTEKRIHAGIILTAKDEESGSSDAAKKAEELKDVDSEAIWVAAKIKELIAGGRKAGDITILLKTLTHQRQFERYLRQAGIPYASEAVSGFFDDSPVNDMTACLRWCVYPADRISYATLLKSPFVRLSDNAVRAVLAGQPISPEEQARLDEATGRLNAFKTDLEHISIAEAVTRLWYSLGYQFETRWNDTVALYSELYDFLFELACRADADNRTISWFVDYLQALSDNNGKLDDMDIPLERKDAVRIMTIHKSKGLEFPVVFLCNTSSRSNNMEASSSAFFTKDWGVSINTGKLPGIKTKSSITLKNNYFYELSHEIEKKMEWAELERVLYVGVTRACDELYITGFSKDDSFELSKGNKEKEQNGTYIPGNIHALMRPLYYYYKDKPDESPFTLETHPLYSRTEADALLSISRTSRPNTEDMRTRTAETGAPLFESATSPAPYTSARQTWNPSHLGLSGADGVPATESGTGAWPVEADNPPPASIFAQVDALIKEAPAFTNAHFGTLAHAAIEEAYTGETIRLSPEIAAALTDKQRENALRLARELAPCFSGSELGQLAKRAAWRQNEYDFKMRLPASKGTNDVPVTVKGQIDLLFETEENGETVIYIIDFKTDSVERPEEHVTQLACYSHAARQMRPLPDGGQKKTRCWLYYLRSGHAVEITADTGKISPQDFAPLPQQEQTLQSL